MFFNCGKCGKLVHLNQAAPDAAITKVCYECWKKESMIADIQKTAHEVYQQLKTYNGVGFPEIKPASLEFWTKDYACFDTAYYDTSNEEHDYFDHAQFKKEYEAHVRTLFTGCNVNFYWQSQEIEITRPKS